jgi:tetratricopeptide (TPR) repeat protein
VLLTYGAVLRPGRGADSAGEHGVALAASRDAFAARRYQDALDPTLALTKAFPNQQVYAERLAAIYHGLGRRGDEAAAWEQFVNVSPTPVEACPQMPEAYAAAGSPDRALDAFERCVKFEPKNTDMLFFLGRFHEHAGRREQAAAAYRQAAELDGSTDSRLGLARVDLHAGRLQDADRAARVVLATQPDNADALLVAGLAAQRLGRTADARRDLTRALAVAERYVDVHIALGVLEFSAGRTADAGRHFRRALELDPARRGELQIWLDRVGGQS